MPLNFDKKEYTPNRSFKERKSLATRREEFAGLRARFPDKVMVVVERYSSETNLPLLDKTKFLVPEELNMSQFLMIIRRRMRINQNQAIYLIVNNKSLTCMSKTVNEVYREHKDEDGFLYITYASQNMFGCSSASFNCWSNC